MRFLGTMDGHVVTLGFDPVNLRCFQEINSTAGLDYQAFEVFVTRFHLFQEGQNSLVGAAIAVAEDLGPGTLPGGVEAFLIEWFQQIVEGVYFKCADRILVVSSDENDSRNVFPEGLKQLETAELGHLYIKKDQIG